MLNEHDEYLTIVMGDGDVKNSLQFSLTYTHTHTYVYTRMQAMWIEPSHIYDLGEKKNHSNISI